MNQILLKLDYEVKTEKQNKESDLQYICGGDWTWPLVVSTQR